MPVQPNMSGRCVFARVHATGQGHTTAYDRGIPANNTAISGTDYKGSGSILTTIGSLYRVEDGHVLIEMKLSSVAQLFNSFDPAPFHEKDLDINAESYIVDAVNDFSSKTRFRIVVYLPDEVMGTKDARAIPAAIGSHFGYKSLMQKRKFRQRFVYGEFALVVGLSFLAIATLASLAVDSYSRSYPSAHFIANALVIAGWVAMWEPVTVFLFQLWPIVRQRKVYEMISRIDVDIRQYPKVPVPVPEIPVKSSHNTS